MYYTTSDPETHVLYAIFDHDKDKVFTKKIMRIYWDV